MYNRVSHDEQSLCTLHGRLAMLKELSESVRVLYIVDIYKCFFLTMVPFLLTFPIWYWLNVRSRNIRIRMRLRAVCMMGGPNIADILNLWIHEYGHPPKYGLSRLYLYRATYPARLSPIICLSKYRFKETFQCCSEFSFFCRIHNLYTSFQNKLAKLRRWMWSWWWTRR